MWRVCAAQVRERRRAQRFSRFGVVVECLQFAPFPQNFRKNSGGRLATLRVPFVYGIVQSRPRRGYTAAVFTAISSEFIRSRLPRLSHVVPASRRAPFRPCNASGGLFARVIGFSVIPSRRLAVQPSPRGRYLPRTIKKYKNTGKMRKKKRFLCVLGVVYKLFIIYIWGIEKDRGFYSLEKEPGRVFLGNRNGVIQNRYLKFRATKRKSLGRLHYCVGGSRFLFYAYIFVYISG